MAHLLESIELLLLKIPQIQKCPIGRFLQELTSFPEESDRI